MQNESTVQITPSIRPRFRFTHPLPPNQIINDITQALQANATTVKGTVVAPHITLRIPLAERHYWSPQLDLVIEKRDEGSLVRGLFGPSPSVWFMYVFFYSVLGFVSLMVSIIGFSQLNLGLSAKILWILPIVLVLFLLTYSTARMGQRLGNAEMKLLYKFAQEAIG
ncbi:MAG: hypothetical protein AAF960_03195 [Bacteroidota bacterium]